MNRLGAAGGLGAALTLAFAVSAAAQDVCPEVGGLNNVESPTMRHIRFLADDLLEGRRVGTRGERCAAEYIARELELLGLEPAGDNGTFFQGFPVRSGATLGAVNTLNVSGRTYALGSEWTPLGFSASGEVSAPLVYGGYGINQPGNDRYARLDIERKVVVVEWGDPRSPHGTSFMAEPHFKATVAGGRRAAGMIILLPRGAVLPRHDSENRAALRIPVVAVSGDVAESIRAATQEGSSAALITNVAPAHQEARNVVAILPGFDPRRRNEHVVIGAHYDHLGFGGDNSLATGVTQVHNGADDNASGTAALIEIARSLANGPRLERSVLFIAFTGEEQGLWGSAYFVENPTVPILDAVAMLNFDMVGRMTRDDVVVDGFGTAVEWDEIVDGLNASMARPLDITKSEDGYGASDHQSFYSADMPVLHFFTGTHMDYHRPSDDWPKINADGIDRIVELASAITRRLTADAADATLTFVKTDPPAPPGAAASNTGGDPAYLGSIPDMVPRDRGVRLTGVREGSPAEKGGLQGGDVIVEFNGKEIGDLYAYTYALRETKPGDVVRVVVERDGERVVLEVTLGRR